MMPADAIIILLKYMSNPVPESYLDGLLPGATPGTPNYASQEKVDDTNVEMI